MLAASVLLGLMGIFGLFAGTEAPKDILKRKDRECSDTAAGKDWNWYATDHRRR
jgi:hypothetical protein